MDCVDQAAAEVRARLEWPMERVEAGAGKVELSSSLKGRRHTLLAPEGGGDALEMLTAMVRALHAETHPTLYLTSEVWGVSLPSQFVQRRFYLNIGREWFVAGQVHAFCPEAYLERLSRERRRLIGAPAPRPLNLDRLSLSSDERARIEDGLLLAQVRYWLDSDAPHPDPLVRAVALSFLAADPESPGVEALQAVVNGLCLAFARRIFTPNRERGYWFVENVVQKA